MSHRVVAEIKGTWRLPWAHEDKQENIGTMEVSVDPEGLVVWLGTRAILQGKEATAGYGAIRVRFIPAERAE